MENNRKLNAPLHHSISNLPLMNNENLWVSYSEKEKRKIEEISTEYKEFLNKGIIGKVIRFKSEMFSCWLDKWQ